MHRINTEKLKNTTSF